MPQQPDRRRGAHPSGGDLEAESRLYPTRRAAAGAVGFLRYVDQVQPRQVRIGGECDCAPLGWRRCCHFDELAAPMANPVSTSVRHIPPINAGMGSGHPR